jgi:Flp pilus assembly protein TadG
MKRPTSGHAMLELTLVAAVMLAFLSGTLQFGYAFYIYNQLVTAVGSGARYAASRTYRAATPKDIEKGREAIRNLVAYGDPHPGPGAAPIIPQLKPEDVEVQWNLGKSGAPESVDVAIANHRVGAVFATFNFKRRPSFEFPFVGRYAPAESER